jgi:hypothetical protein
VTSGEMRELLRELHRAKHVMRHTHASAARHVTDYDFNNTYQYIIAREDMHLRWLVDAILDLGGSPDESPVADVQPSARGEEAQQEVILDDRDGARRFLDTWRPRIDGLPNARHTVMLRVILGETAEHQRFFDLALAGRSDLLGRRADGAGTSGRVLPDRWVGGG